MKNKKILYLILFIVSFYTEIHAQSAQENNNKYWLYRDRLRKYFVVVDPNNGFGTNIPFWYDAYHISLTTGDGNDGLQYYIGMLATEYALLKKYDLDYTQTRNELLYALKAVERLDLFAENYYRQLPNVRDNGNGTGTNDGNTDYTKIPTGGNVHAGDLNGFFVRDDIGANFITRYPDLNNYNKVLSTFVEGQGRNMPYEESKDNIWNYMPNLALVYVLVDDPAIQEKVKDITFRMVSYMQITLTKNVIDSDDGLIEFWKEILGIEAIDSQTTFLIWRILNPVTGFKVVDGADVEEVLPMCANMDGFNYGFAESANFITNNNQLDDPLYPNLHFGCSESQGRENYFYNFIIYPSLWTGANPHFALATVGGNTPDYQKYSMPNQTIMDALITNIYHPLEHNQVLLDNLPLLNSFKQDLFNIKDPIEYECPATLLEHLPLIRTLIVNYQIKHGNNTNISEQEVFNNYVQNTNLKQFYEHLLNSAPLCGPTNLGETAPNRIDDWCMSNRLTKSHMITQLNPIETDPDRVKINNPWNNGVFPGIDYLMLHNLYWLNFIPSDKIVISNCSTYSNQEGRQITSACTIPSNTTISYTASENISLKPGFSAQVGSKFSAKINADWSFHYSDPSNLIANNNCYSGKPFTSPAPTLKSYSIVENNSDVQLQLDTTALTQNDEINLKIAPNPNNGNFNVIIPNYMNNFTVQLFNNVGVLLETYKSNGDNSIPITVKSTGVYFIVVSVDGKTYQKQVVCNK